MPSPAVSPPSSPRVIWADIYSSEDEGAASPRAKPAAASDDGRGSNSGSSSAGLTHDDVYDACTLLETGLCGCEDFPVEYEQCHGEHDLVEFTARDASYKCKCCQTVVPQGAKLWGCQACSYDVCARCRDGAVPVIKAEPTVTAAIRIVELKEEEEEEEEEGRAEVVEVEIEAEAPAPAAARPAFASVSFEEDSDDDFTIVPVEQRTTRAPPPTSYGHSWSYKQRHGAAPVNEEAPRGAPPTAAPPAAAAPPPAGKKEKKKRRGGRKARGRHAAREDEAWHDAAGAFATPPVSHPSPAFYAAGPPPPPPPMAYYDAMSEYPEYAYAPPPPPPMHAYSYPYPPCPPEGCV